MADKTQTWRKLILREMNQHNDSFENIVAMTLSSGEIDLDGVQWEKFTIWTEKRIYFPANYECDLWCESVPRNPCDEKTQPAGG